MAIRITLGPKSKVERRVETPPTPTPAPKKKGKGK